MADNIEQRLGELEDEMEELKSTIAAGASKKWKALAIAGIWLGAAVICFSPHMAGNFSNSALCALIATIAIAQLWN